MEIVTGLLISKIGTLQKHEEKKFYLSSIILGKNMFLVFYKKMLFYVHFAHIQNFPICIKHLIT